MEKERGITIIGTGNAGKQAAIELAKHNNLCVLKPTMQLKWVEKEIVKEGGSLGKKWATMTGKYEKVLHQKFIDEKGNEEWVEVPTE